MCIIDLLTFSTAKKNQTKIFYLLSLVCEFCRYICADRLPMNKYVLNKNNFVGYDSGLFFVQSCDYSISKKKKTKSICTKLFFFL